MEETDHTFQAREIIQKRIQKGLLGPGSETWGLPDDEEIISDFPLQRYFTGILFPDKTRSKTQDEADEAKTKSETLIDGEIEGEQIEAENEEQQKNNNISTNEIEEDRISQNSFFPTNIAISICLPKEVEEIDVTFSFGLYYQPSNEETKIKISEEGFNSFFDPDIPFQLPFRNILNYENGFMFLERRLKGKQRGKNRSEEYKGYTEFKKSANLKDKPAQNYVSQLEKLVNSRVWKRKPYNIRLSIPIENTQTPIPVDLGGDSNKNAKAGYNLKVVTDNDFKYVKVQLVNCSEIHPADRFSNKSEQLNLKCLFQAGISIESDQLREYRDNSISTFSLDDELADTEALELDFTYREVKNFGVGHNCSVIWEKDEDDENVTKVSTAFMPYQNLKELVNSFDENDTKLNEVLDIKNLSVWGLSKKNVIENLNYFIEKYEDWIGNQINQNDKNDGDFKKIGKQLIERQQYNLERLNNNIKLLKDEKIFRAFQIANTAMYLQLITSNDKDFGKEEKELSEINTEVKFDSINFFENYDAQLRRKKGKINFIPRYRPFQLAFLLLSMKGIVNPDSRSRQEIVDLIWFPTGGGKTEAYLAVAAFTIIYRRLSNKNEFQGTTVIMRYTLRLLTAQQFERASRLVLALEFLRNQGSFKDDLREDPINIGLWVGQASTPNRLKDAKKQLKDIDEEAYNRNKDGKLTGDPADKNIFQISSCPWCGTKLISKTTTSSGKKIWKRGFEERRNNFVIKCINEACHFSRKIPVQVVDEILYDEPPTLLFGTVDKFAMISWQEKAHNFFNSQNDNALPPDLIIQDELHLLSGPLGSISGIFESVIELLCEENGIGPKIIASTATTRNTGHQVKKLYGNREVNIFPPSGITYDDSFFAHESRDESRRKYLGFMPTGKTSLDTQLQLLAHLLVARLEIYANKETKDQLDKYWTIVSYYNSLKNVGKIFNKVGDEVFNYTSTLQNRLSEFFQPYQDHTFNYYGLSNRTQELTSRIDSTKIKTILKKIEKSFNQDKINKSPKGNTYLNDIIDLVLATNMISVGIDISRLNIMLLNGMPKNVAEYIQASSRVGREDYGLVITLLNANRAREKSYFEHFKNFHQTFYKSVEPLSITPFTKSTIDKMVTSLMVAYVRNKVPGMSGNGQAQHFQKEMIEPFKKWINNRFSDSQFELSLFQQKIDNLANDWVDKIDNVDLESYNQLLKRPKDSEMSDGEWTLMQSMREVDTNTYIQIKEVF